MVFILRLYTYALTHCQALLFWHSFDSMLRAMLLTNLLQLILDSDLTRYNNIYIDLWLSVWYNRVYLKALEGNVYSNKDMVMDALGGVMMGAAFIVMWIVGAYADLATVGF